MLSSKGTLLYLILPRIPRHCEVVSESIQPYVDHMLRIVWNEKACRQGNRMKC